MRSSDNFHAIAKVESHAIRDIFTFVESAYGFQVDTHRLGPLRLGP